MSISNTLHMRRDSAKERAGGPGEGLCADDEKGGLWVIKRGVRQVCDASFGSHGSFMQNE